MNEISFVDKYIFFAYIWTYLQNFLLNLLKESSINSFNSLKAPQDAPLEDG